MKPRVVLTLFSLFLLSAALIAGGTDSGKVPPAPIPIPAGTASMTVYKDPITGRLGPVPADQLRTLLSEDLRRTISSSDEGLIEKPAPGGGMMVDLQGRFQSVIWATTAANGGVTTHCDQIAPESAADTKPPTQSRKE